MKNWAACLQIWHSNTLPLSPGELDRTVRYFNEPLTPEGLFDSKSFQKEG